MYPYFWSLSRINSSEHFSGKGIPSGGPDSASDQTNWNQQIQVKSPELFLLVNRMKLNSAITDSKEKCVTQHITGLSSPFHITPHLDSWMSKKPLCWWMSKKHYVGKSDGTGFFTVPWQSNKFISTQEILIGTHTCDLWDSSRNCPKNLPKGEENSFPSIFFLDNRVLRQLARTKANPGALSEQPDKPPRFHQSQGLEFGLGEIWASGKPFSCCLTHWAKPLGLSIPNPIVPHQSETKWWYIAATDMKYKVFNQNTKRTWNRVDHLGSSFSPT